MVSTSIRVLIGTSESNVLNAVINALDLVKNVQWLKTICFDPNELVVRGGRTHYDLVVLCEGFAGGKTKGLIQNIRELPGREKTVFFHLGAMSEDLRGLAEILEQNGMFVHASGGQFASIKAGLDKAVLGVFANRASAYEDVRISKGEFLMRAGDEAREVFILKSGHLQVSLGDGEEHVVLGEISPGQFVGEMAQFLGGVRTADVVALQDSELMKIPLDQFERQLRTKATLNKQVLNVMIERVSTSVKALPSFGKKVIPMKKAG